MERAGGGGESAPGLLCRSGRREAGGRLHLCDMCRNLVSVKMFPFRNCEPLSVLELIRSIFSFSEQNKAGGQKRSKRCLKACSS